MKRKKGLLPCPFCGGEPELFILSHDRDEDVNYYDIECQQCGAMMLTPKDHMLSEDKNKLIKMWNKRI